MIFSGLNFSGVKLLVWTWTQLVPKKVATREIKGTNGWDNPPERNPSHHFYRRPVNWAEELQDQLSRRRLNIGVLISYQNVNSWSRRDRRQILVAYYGWNWEARTSRYCRMSQLLPCGDEEDRETATAGFNTSSPTLSAFWRVIRLRSHRSLRKKALSLWCALLWCFLE